MSAILKSFADVDASFHLTSLSPALELPRPSCAGHVGAHVSLTLLVRILSCVSYKGSVLA